MLDDKRNNKLDAMLQRVNRAIAAMHAEIKRLDALMALHQEIERLRQVLDMGAQEQHQQIEQIEQIEDKGEEGTTC